VTWFTTFGWTALHLEMFGPGGIADLVNEIVELALFETLGHLPLSQITIVLSVILIFIFFITSADSATYVLGAMTTNESLFPSLRVKLIWGILIAGTATVLLISGGGGLDALQTASLIAALPFLIIMLFMIASIFIMVKRDWQVRERKSKIKHDTQVKEDFRDEFLDDVKDEVYDEFSEEAYDDLKEKVYDEVYDEF